LGIQEPITRFENSAVQPKTNTKSSPISSEKIFTMPGYYDKVAPSHRRGSSGNAQVGFAETLVTGVSRPLSTKEGLRVYYFERHCEKCERCYRPHSVFRRGRQLCSEGHELAIRVVELMFRLRSDGEIVSRSREEHQEIRVEIPAKYHHVVGLFRAIREGGGSFLEEERSYDRHYSVKERSPRSKSVPDPYRHREREPTRDLVIVEPSSPRRKRSSKEYRGSLYLADVRDQEHRDKREGRSRYEVYAPQWDPGYHR
jgi:hypothetical protein